jgi:RNA polymerase sigma factor (sigma-70 family)
MNKIAHRNRVELGRFREHFGTNPTHRPEPEGRFRDRFTSRHADDRKAGQKKYSAASVFPRPVSLGSEARWCAKWPQERREARQYEVGSASFARVVAFSVAVENVAFRLTGDPAAAELGGKVAHQPRRAVQYVDERTHPFGVRMADQHARAVVRLLAGDATPDADLLARCRARRDEEALAELVRRYARLVRGAATRVLRDPADIDDAVQATFLVLTRRAATLAARAGIGPWLYGVAHRIAVRLRERNRLRPAPLGDAEPAGAALPDPSWREACDALHAELDRLPDRYRLPLLLCYLEGQTRDEAADSLGLSVGTVKGRIRRGIEMLRRRLERRGVSLSAGLLAAVAVPRPVAAGDPVTLALGAASPRAYELAKEFTMRMAVWKWTAGIAVVLGTCAAVAAVVGAGDQPPDRPLPPVQPPLLVQPPMPAAQPVPALAKPAGPPDVTLKFRELDGTLKRWVYRATFSPANDLVAAGSRDTILVWSIDGGKPISRMRLPDADSHHIHLAFTPDGQTLVSAPDSDTKVRFWDVKTGKQLRELDYPHGPPPKGDYMPFKAFGPGATMMAVDVPWRLDRDGKGGIDIVDLATGKVKTEIRGPDLNGGSWMGCDFSPDGKLLAVNGERDAVRLFDTATGKLVRELRPANEGVNGKHGSGAIRFSTDGRFLVACEHTGRVEIFDKYRAVVWSVADGKRQLEVPDLGAPALSRDNRYIVIGSLTQDRPFLLDLLTGKEATARNPQTGDWRLIGHSPDGRTLAYAAPTDNRGEDYQVYLTSAPDLPEPLVGNGPPNADALALLWGGWGSDSEFRRAYAWKILAAHPDLALGYAREHLGPVAAADAKRVDELVKLLDDDSPDVRDKATADLSAVAHAFESLLTATLAAAGPGEVRNRLTSVLRRAKETPTPPELKIALRGVALVEKLGTPAAKELLGRLAKGAPGARVTDEAAAALKRLGG